MPRTAFCTARYQAKVRCLEKAQKAWPAWRGTCTQDAMQCDVDTGRGTAPVPDIALHGYGC